ncbi:MAG TPA: hypothetical protein VJ461_01720 [Candidatus Nanoarchaeia archaeon]|nr:hypothetical protein [Candidatus Nanoarchaeia archaeon]
MSPSDFFKPNLAKILWLTAFFVISFEALWIQMVCIRNTCQAWYFSLFFWVFSWPFYFVGKLPNRGAYVLIEIIFFIAMPFLYYYLLACVAARFFSKKRRS